MTRQIGSPVVRGAVLGAGREDRIRSRVGRRKARVLPLPVWARQSTFDPEKQERLTKLVEIDRYRIGTVLLKQNKQVA